MCLSFYIDIFSKNDYKKNVAPIKRACASSQKKRKSGDGELEAKYVKIIRCHVPRAQVPERLACLP